jgi:hypothetical protein
MYKRKRYGGYYTPYRRFSTRYSTFGPRRTYSSISQGNRTRESSYPSYPRRTYKKTDGGYGSTFLGSLGNALGRGVGGSLGYAGANLLKYGGLRAMRMFRNLRGYGAYYGNKKVYGPQPPRISNSGPEGAVTVKHKEFIGYITSSEFPSTFKNNVFIINPTNATTFPWLSQIATRFEEYEIKGLIFQYKSVASDAIANGTNIAMGDIMMCTQYDATNIPFEDESTMLNYEGAQVNKVSQHSTHYVECARNQTPLSHLYTGNGSYPGDSDLRFQNFGILNVATSGIQGTNQQVGQLWVSYQFCFYKPRLLHGEAGQMYSRVMGVGKTDGVSSGYWLGNPSSFVEDYQNTFKTIIQVDPSDLNTYELYIGPTNTEVPQTFMVKITLWCTNKPISATAALGGQVTSFVLKGLTGCTLMQMSTDQHRNCICHPSALYNANVAPVISNQDLGCISILMRITTAPNVKNTLKFTYNQPYYFSPTIAPYTDIEQIQCPYADKDFEAALVQNKFQDYQT